MHCAQSSLVRRSVTLMCHQPTRGSANDEEVGCPYVLVVVVVSGGLPWGGGGEWFPHLAHELLALLIEAHLRETLVIGASVDLQAKYLRLVWRFSNPTL